MPSAPNTDDNGTDQPDTNPSSQPGTADSGDEASTAPDTGEAEADAAGPSKAATDTGDSEGEPFPPRGTLTLRALRWGGLLGAVVLAATALMLRRELKDPGSLVPDGAFTSAGFMTFGALLVWPLLNFREKKRPVLVTIMITVMAALGTKAAASLTLTWWSTYHRRPDSPSCSSWHWQERRSQPRSS